MNHHELELLKNILGAIKLKQDLLVRDFQSHFHTDSASPIKKQLEDLDQLLDDLISADSRDQLLGALKKHGSLIR